MGIMTTQDVSPEKTWQALKEDRQAVLIDVRTKAEWAWVGGPDLSALKAKVRQVEWQTFPGMARNPAFADQIAALGLRPEQPLYLICRSGVRSKAAAELLSALGYTTYNVAGGFEGQIDPSGHRGGKDGWKVAGLPWKQS